MYKQSKSVKSKCTLRIEICHLLEWGFISSLRRKGKVEVTKFIVLSVEDEVLHIFHDLLSGPSVCCLGCTCFKFSLREELPHCKGLTVSRAEKMGHKVLIFLSFVHSFIHLFIHSFPYSLWSPFSVLGTEGDGNTTAELSSSPGFRSLLSI